MIIPNDVHIKIFTNIMIHILNNKLSEIILKYSFVQDRNETEHEYEVKQNT